jgi:hypothetical protein
MTNDADDLRNVDAEVKQYFKDKRERAENSVLALKQLFDNEKYWDIEDYIVLRSLQGLFESMIRDVDRWETPDNVLHDISALCRVIKIHMVPSEYDEYMQTIRDGIWKKAWKYDSDY